MDAHLDYLRLATWDYDSYLSTKAKLISGWPAGWLPGKWLQYKGWRKEQLFIGHGEQRGDRHCLTHISGFLSHRLYPSFAKIPEWYATRIDVQVTIEMPEDYRSLRYIRNICDNPSLSLIESENNDTLYLGKRSSDIFTRLYEKIIMGKKFLRLEFELKGARSRAGWLAISDQETPAAIFKYYLSRVGLPEDVQTWFEDVAVEATEKAMRDEIESDDKKKLAWLVSLESSIREHMANPNIGHEVKNIVRLWAEYADELDRKQFIE